MHLKARKMALCGILCALAEGLLLTSGMIPIAVYCGPLLAMIVLLPVREEYGSGAAVTAWCAVALLGLLLVPDKELVGIYLFLGWYPAAQPYLDRLRPRSVRILCKIAVCDAAVAALYALLLYVFALNAVAEEFADASMLWLVGLFILGNITALVTDEALRRMALVWQHKLRRRLFRDN